jgi:hypothetical protein
VTGHRIVPRFRYITDITNAQYATVTFSEDHDYSDGEIVSFRVTPPFGMFEINNLQSRVIAHTDDAITIEIDTTFWTPFIYPVSGAVTPPVCVPSASGIIPGSYPSTVNLEDCFDNIRT